MGPKQACSLYRSGLAASPSTYLQGNALFAWQGPYDDQVRDTELDAPMSNLHLQQHLQPGDGLVGSWPGAARQSNTADAALPFFQGRPIRTSSNLSNMSGVQRTSSFTGHPGSARGMGVSEGGFAGADQLCFASCNSTPITPRSPSFGFGEEVSSSWLCAGQQHAAMLWRWMNHQPTASV